MTLAIAATGLLPPATLPHDRGKSAPRQRGDLWWPMSLVSRHFRVGPRRLLSYCQRGNLPSRRLGGEWFVSLAHVKRLFVPRDSSHQRVVAGRLGALRLGDVPG